MKNLLFASWYIGLGGGETDLVTLAQDLNPQHYTPHLLLPSEGQLADTWRKHGWQVHIVPFRGVTTYFIPPIWMRFPVVQKIKHLLLDQKIDLVHSDYHTLPFMVAACRQAHIPLMWTVHGWWFKPHFWQTAFFRPLKAVARSISIQQGFLGTPPFMPIENLPVIYSGVDITRFHPRVDGGTLRQELDFTSDVPIVAMIARFQSVKGHEVFQAMAREVAQHMPEVQFVVAGEDVFGVSSDRDYKARILAIAQDDPQLQGRLHYIGFREDVERVMAMADVIVCASDFESYGKVNLEAMASGKAVVSTNRGGSSETVVHGETGFLVPPQSPQEMAFYVLHLLQNPEERAHMGQKGRVRVENHFSANQTTQAYTTLFEKLLVR